MTNFKYLQKIFFLLVMGFSLSVVCVACGDDEDDEPVVDPSKNTTDIAVTGKVGKYGCTYADIIGYANLNQLPAGSGNPKIGVEIRLADSDEDYSDKEMTESLTGNEFMVEFDDLHPNSEYEYRSFVEYGGLTHYGEYRTFTTKQAYNVTSTGAASDVMYHSATITSRVKLSSIDERDNIRVGVAYSTRKTALHKDGSFDTKVVDIDDESNKEYVVNLSSLSVNTTYYYASFTLIGEEYAFSDVHSFKTEESLTVGTLNGYDWVDLGLSVKWATCNVGAFSPEDYGGYYAWGETEEKSDYDWPTYRWGNGSENTMIKYCIDRDYGLVDNKTVLVQSDDVAHVRWGGSWRIPTWDEFKELLDECTWEGTTFNGVNGFLVTGTNGNTIFFPTAGGYYGTEINRGRDGYYWSASLYDYDYGAYCLELYNGNVRGAYYYRYGGLSVRPVTDELLSDSEK